MKKYSVMLYPYKHESKQHAQKFVGAIKNSILKYPQELTVTQLAKAVTSGHTVILGHAEYSQEETALMRENKKSIGAGTKHWKHQQIFAIDFDNEDNNKDKLTGDKYFSISKALIRCKTANIPVAFCYTTGSHTEEHHKFRLIFVLDQIIDTLKHHQDVINSLFNVFLVNDECIVDIKCCDPCRLFYPGKTIIYKNPSAVVNTDKLIKDFNSIAMTARRANSSKHTAVNKEKMQNNASEMIELIKAAAVEKILPKIVSSLDPSDTRVFTGLEGSQHWLKQESIIYLTKDTCFHQCGRPTKPAVVRHPDDYYAITRKFPLHLLLGLPKNENISCILPTHTDAKPSARIELDANGDYIYHCYGCDSYLDIFNVIERITGWSHLQAKAFVNKLLHIKFETEWQLEKKAEIIEYQDYIWSNQFAISHPLLQKRLACAKILGVLNLMLQMARLYIYDRKIVGNENPLFYISLSLLVKKAKDFGHITTKSTLHKKIKLLTRLGLIEIVAEKNLPTKFRRELQARKTENEQHYRINCFTIPKFSMELLDLAETKLCKAEQNGMRRKYYCREAEFRANGEKSANEQYVQDEHKALSVKIEKFYIKYKAAAIRLLTIKGWITEKEILTKLTGYTAHRKKEFSGICLPQLLKEAALKRVAYSKYYETKFAIEKGLHYGVSKIIVTI